MDSLVNYASDGENSNNSEDSKMPHEERQDPLNRQACDANYDPVQMDMSEESNNNNSSEDSDSERTNTPVTLSVERTDSLKSNRQQSPSDQRRPDHESLSSNSREEQKRGSNSRNERSKCSSSSADRNSRHRSSYDEKRRTNDPRDKDSKKSRDDDRKWRDDDSRRRDRGECSSSSGSSRDEKGEDKEKSGEKEHYHRDERRDRDRDRGDRDRRRDRDRDRRHSRDDRQQKDRHRDDRSSHYKEKDHVRSRSRSRDRGSASFRSMSYREEKGRSKLAQLEKLGIELKAPENDIVISNTPGEQNYYNPLATASQGKYAEQIQKRKLLWANKAKPEDGKLSNTTSTTNTWVGTTFTHDQDGKVTAKFKRLMGIKEDLPAAAASGAKPDILKKQEEMFNNMEQQYEVARATTHTQRGVGLGYASSGYQFPR